jgi:DmsE family decaheme c-type cytochrome
MRATIAGSLAFLSALLLAAGIARAQEAYVGDSVCLGCHEKVHDAYAKTLHAKVLVEGARMPLMARGCEACHGPGQAHVEAGGGRGVGAMLAFRAEGPEAVARENEACLACHGRSERLHWEGSPHESRDVACTTCHTLMRNVSDRRQLARATQIELCTSCHLIPRAQIVRNAHMPVQEGFLSCSSCHNPHGSANERLLRRETVNDLCYACHAEKRGPFLWEHPPVMENCLNCHEPHGSNREAMLKVSKPRLCQQCHIPTLHPTEARLGPGEEPEGPVVGSRFLISSSCVQCHSNIHGSNHPSGFAFTR